MNQQSQPRQVQIKASDEKLKGEYSNVMRIFHTKEEFVLDFLNIFPPAGTLNSRIILSPGHFRRMIDAMKENLKKYEKSFKTTIEPSEDPETLGFK